MMVAKPMQLKPSHLTSAKAANCQAKVQAKLVSMETETMVNGVTLVVA
jgi:hypothetical protein